MYFYFATLINQLNKSSKYLIKKHDYQYFGENHGNLNFNNFSVKSNWSYSKQFFKKGDDFGIATVAN